VQIVPFWAPWRGLADRDLRRLDRADRRGGCREQLVAAESGPPRSQRHHERAAGGCINASRQSRPQSRPNGRNRPGRRDWRSYAPPSAIC